MLGRWRREKHNCKSDDSSSSTAAAQAVQWMHAHASRQAHDHVPHSQLKLRWLSSVPVRTRRRSEFTISPLHPAKCAGSRGWGGWGVGWWWWWWGGGGGSSVGRIAAR